MLHRNGTPPGSPAVEQNAAATPPRTEFPSDRPIDSSRALIYHLSRRQLAGVLLIRWLYGLLLAATVFWLPLPAYGSWAAALTLLLLAALWLWQWTARRRGYVHFAPSALPPPAPRPLLPSEKLPVYVSGLLTVENKVRRFAALPGFYRTFATREHALLCHLRRLGGAVDWPEDEVGLWYAFFAAAHIHGVRTGEIAFDRQSLLGFALDYTPAQPLGGKKQRRPQRLTLYVAFADPAACQVVLADLTVEPIVVQTHTHDEIKE